MYVLHCITESIERRILGKTTIQLLFIHSFTRLCYQDFSCDDTSDVVPGPAPAPYPTVEGMLLALKLKFVISISSLLGAVAPMLENEEVVGPGPASAPSPAGEAT